MNFDEICRRAAGRRAYNRRRRLARARRISAILALQARAPHLTGRELAALLGVHEATVSRDLKFVALIRRRWRKMMGGAPPGFKDVPMLPQNFRWVRDGRGWEFKFHWRDDVRVL
jgi:hypothetical protein